MNSNPPKTAEIFAPPPLLYLSTIAIGCASQIYSPHPITSSVPISLGIGGLLFVLSVFLARWSFITMRKIGTSGNPRETSTALAIDGPFRISRNPIYVAMTGMYLGISFLANALWLLVLLLPLLFIMHWGVILREERYLARQFGKAYLEYKSTVRRWL